MAESQSFAAIRTVNESQYQYDTLVIRTGCVSASDTLTCLRSLNATYLQENNFNIASPGAQAPPLYMWGPVLDYDFIQEYTYAAYANGNFVKLPAIYGDVTNEGTVFTPRNTSSIGESDTFLKDQFPAFTLQQLATVNRLYPLAEQFNGSGQYWRQVSNAYGEIRYICPGVFISKTYAAMNLTQNWNCKSSFPHNALITTLTPSDRPLERDRPGTPGRRLRRHTHRRSQRDLGPRERKRQRPSQLLDNQRANRARRAGILDKLHQIS